MKKSGILLALSIVSFSLIVACGGKKEGGSCKGSESACLDKQNALACRQDKFEKIPCGGPLGCTMFEKKANCDDSVAMEGDPCMGATDEEYACSPDKKKALACKGGRFQKLLECRGAGGCTQLGTQLSCDTSLAAKGDPCKTQGQVACSADGTEMVICRDGKFTLHRFCRGPKHCTLDDKTPICDETLSMDGDPCSHQGRLVCSVDGQMELICQGSTFMKSRACRKSGCTVSNAPGHPVICD